MTIKLLTPRDLTIGGRTVTYPAGALVTLDAATETGLINSKEATATLTGGIAYTPPVPSGQPVPLTATTSAQGVEGIQPPEVLTYLQSQISGVGFAAAGWVNAADAEIAGSGDEGAKLNAALAAASGKVFIIPSGMTITSSVPIDVPSNIIIDGRGATLKSACPGLQDRLLRITGKDNVTVVGLTLDGDKANYPTHTEHRHNIFITESTNIRLFGVTSRNAKGDGIYVGDDAVPSRRVYLTQVMCEGNYRNGLAIISAVELVASSCIFRAQVGYHPQAGLDIEGNTDATLIDKISFSSCMFTGNVGYGAMVSFRDTPTVQQGGVTFSGCSFDESTGDGTGFNGHGLRLHNGRAVRVIGGQIRGSAYRGVIMTGNNGSGITIDGVEIAKNGREGISVGTGAVATNLTIVANQIRDNSASAPNSYDAIYLAGATNSIISLNTISGVSQRYGIRVEVGTSGIKAVHNEFGDLGSGQISDTVGDAIWVINKDATLALSRAAASDIALSIKINGDTQPRIAVRADGDIRFGDGTTAGDTRLYRSAADTLRTNDNFIVDQLLTTAKSILNTATDGTGFLEMREQTADPAAPSVNQGRIFVKDNGSGKSQLCVRFNSGAVQVLATEP